MAPSKPAPTSEELNAALDWIKEHKKRSVAHIIILLLLAVPCAGMFGGMLGPLLGFSMEHIAYLAIGYFVVVAGILFLS